MACQRPGSISTRGAGTTTVSVRVVSGTDLKPSLKRSAAHERVMAPMKMDQTMPVRCGCRSREPTDLRLDDALLDFVAGFRANIGSSKGCEQYRKSATKLDRLQEIPTRFTSGANTRDGQACCDGRSTGGWVVRSGSRMSARPQSAAGLSQASTQRWLRSAEHIGLFKRHISLSHAIVSLELIARKIAGKQDLLATRAQRHHRDCANERSADEAEM